LPCCLSPLCLLDLSSSSPPPVGAVLRTGEVHFGTEVLKQWCVDLTGEFPFPVTKLSPYLRPINPETQKEESKK
jgi:hypothetical protein